MNDPIQFVLALDADGVVCDMFPAWVTLHNRLHPERVPYTVSDVYGSRAIADDLFLDMLSFDNLYDEVEPVEGAIEAIAELKRLEHLRIVYATSCTQGMIDAKWRWFQRHGLLPAGKRQAHDLVVGHDKSLVRAHLLVDDHAKNLYAFEGDGLLFDQPWNQKEIWTGHRAYGWSEAVEYIKTRYEWSLLQWSTF